MLAQSGALLRQTMPLLAHMAAASRQYHAIYDVGACCAHARERGVQVPFLSVCCDPPCLLLHEVLFACTFSNLRSAPTRSALHSNLAHAAACTAAAGMLLCCQPNDTELPLPLAVLKHALCLHLWLLLAARWITISTLMIMMHLVVCWLTCSCLQYAQATPQTSSGTRASCPLNRRRTCCSRRGVCCGLQD